MNDFIGYVGIEKVDEEQRMVYGRASTPQLDSQGDVVTVKAMEDALPGYMRFGNIREMHTSSAVGKTKEATVDEGGLFIGAKVVDDRAWTKVKEGVYSGFSIGGRIRSRNPEKAEEITGLELLEISLVDRPANPGAVFDVWKSDGANVVAEKAVEADAPGVVVAKVRHVVMVPLVDHVGERMGA